MCYIYIYIIFYIFHLIPARPKTPFVPGGATTRDKRPFCPGSWLHPGQKGGPLYVSLNLRLPPNLGIPDLRRAADVSHPRLLLRCRPRAPPELRRLHAPAALDDDPARPLTGAPPSPAPCHLVFAVPASTPRVRPRLLRPRRPPLHAAAPPPSQLRATAPPAPRLVVQGRRPRFRRPV